MASFEQRESGYWQAKIRRKGQPVQSKTFRTKVDAEMWARGIENEMDRGVFVNRAEAESTTMTQALDRYEREVSQFKKGYPQEKSRIKSWKSHPLARRSLASLRPTDFAQYKDDRLAAGAAAATVRNDLALLSHLFTICQKEWGIPILNHVQQIRLPRAPNGRVRRLVHDEDIRIEAAFASAEWTGGGTRTNIWIRPAFILAAETAMRRSELLSLRWVDIDLNKQVAHVRKSKIGEARDVPLSKKSVAVIESLPRAINGRVIDTTPSAIDQSWRRCVARARREYEQELKVAGKNHQEIDDDNLLINLTWHDLRHEATSRLADKLQLHELMKVTGHKGTRMLERYYHPRAEDLAKKLG